MEVILLLDSTNCPIDKTSFLRIGSTELADRLLAALTEVSTRMDRPSDNDLTILLLTFTYLVRSLARSLAHSAHDFLPLWAFVVSPT